MHIGIIKKAINVATKSSHYRYKLGAVIFKGPRIISVGNNELRFCSRIPEKYKFYNDSLHAEQKAIINAPRRSLKGADILVVRIVNGNLKSAKPCKMCTAFIDHVGIHNVWYSNADGEIIKLKKK